MSPGYNKTPSTNPNPNMKTSPTPNTNPNPRTRSNPNLQTQSNPNSPPDYTQVAVVYAQNAQPHVVPKWHPEAPERVSNLMGVIQHMEPHSRVQLWASTVNPTPEAAALM